MHSAGGVAEGDLIEASVQRGKIVLTPTMVIDRSKFPTADSEYTPAQRRIIDRELAKGLDDIKAGRCHRPLTGGQGSRFQKAQPKALPTQTKPHKVRAPIPDRTSAP